MIPMPHGCDSCALNVYDEELDAYYCEAYFDEDELYRLQSTGAHSCPYYRPADDDEYQLVRHQN